MVESIKGKKLNKGELPKLLRCIKSYWAAKEKLRI